MSTKHKLDPHLRDVVKLLNNSTRTLKSIESKSGVCTSTMRNWKSGRTRSPQNKTIEFALRALGYERVIVKRG
jgi:hypothetical protein